MATSDCPNDTETKLKRIAWLSSRDENKVFDYLMHHYNESSLRKCYNELEGKKAVGHDGIDKAQYGEELDSNLQALIIRMRHMAYIPGAARQVLIPKMDKSKAKRKLSIVNFEDKIVQKMTHKILESIYEPLFLDCSYGFRPGRGCHDAIRALYQYLYRYEVETVIDMDLANFFGSIDLDILMQILSDKIKDKRFLRYIKRMLKAGVLADGQIQISEEGVPEGSLVGPILANIYAHRVLDQWFEETVKPHCRGRVELFRYCDDGVICCKYENDANRVKRALTKRLEKYKLKLNEDKTRMVNFSKRACRQVRKQQSFDYLGFIIYLGQSRKGTMIPKVKTSGKRIRTKLKRVNEWARRVRSRYRLKQIWEMFCAKLQGHISYYSVTFNVDRVVLFLDHAVKILFKWLNRRSQKRSLTWEKFNLFLNRHPLPKVKVMHTLY